MAEPQEELHRVRSLAELGLLADASAAEGTGLDEVWDSVEKHRALLEESGLLEERRRRQTERWLDSMIEEAVLVAVHRRPGVEAAIEAARAEVEAGKVTVPQATQKVIEAAGLAPDK